VVELDPLGGLGAGMMLVAALVGTALA